MRVTPRCFDYGSNLKVCHRVRGHWKNVQANRERRGRCSRRFSLIPFGIAVGTLLLQRLALALASGQGWVRVASGALEEVGQRKWDRGALGASGQSLVELKYVF